MAKSNLSKALAPKESRFSFKLSDYPIGAKVAYTGERVESHARMQGTIVGYRPSNGLWVKFPNGTGSISVKFAKVLGGGKKVSKKAPEPASESASISRFPELDPPTPE